MFNIYKITNPNNESYIGRTSNFKTRIDKYRNIDCKKQKKLYASMVRYGFSEHKIQIVEACETMQEACELEKHYINKFDTIKTGLNIHQAGKMSKNITHDGYRTVTIQYKCKHRVSFAPNYVWTICGKCVNLKTNRPIKQVYKSGCIGYVIKSKFYSLKKLRTQMEVIPKKESLPF